MSDSFDRETIVKLVGVFVAALLAINAVEYLGGAIARGEVMSDIYAILSILLLVVLFAALFAQTKRPS